jgi:hypothetical protein
MASLPGTSSARATSRLRQSPVVTRWIASLSAEKACACVATEPADRMGSSCSRERSGLILGGRSTVGHVALDHVIGVRIPASQPAFARLRRASARSARLSRADVPVASSSREGCLAEAPQLQRSEGGRHFLSTNSMASYAETAYDRCLRLQISADLARLKRCDHL